MTYSASSAQAAQPLAVTRAQILESSLGRLAAAPAQLLASRQLRCRIDTKFFVPVTRLASLLADLGDDYGIVEDMDRRVANYETLYFDDAGLWSFHAHQRAQLPRCKVRIRHYLDRAASFLELKREQEAGRQEKHRWQLPYGLSTLSAERLVDLQRVAGILPAVLEPRLWTNFRRVTLVSKSRAERVTIDTDLVFRNEQQSYEFGQLAIVEVKQARLCRQTRVMQALGRGGFVPRPISKYCTATHLLMNKKPRRYP